MIYVKDQKINLSFKKRKSLDIWPHPGMCQCIFIKNFERPCELCSKVMRMVKNNFELYYQNLMEFRKNL